MNRKIALVSVITVLMAVSTTLAQTLEEDWTEFLHYTAIGRFDVAAGFAQKIIDQEPDPLALLKLSEDNPAGYGILQKVYMHKEELKVQAGKILDIIESGRYLRRTDPRIITEEIERLSRGQRAKLTAIARLRNSNEFAIPFMLDALATESRKGEFADITSALGELGRHSISPLVASLQMKNIPVKAEVIRALGRIGYAQSLGSLKYIAENDESVQLRQLAGESIAQINPKAAENSAADLFFGLGRAYYYRNDSVAPAEDHKYASVWFWDDESQRLKRQEVDKAHFNELMAMRACEWALKADPDTGKAIALWLAAFFKAEATGLEQPKYFGTGHADAMTYATTAGAEYLHQALEWAVRDKDADVALGIVESLAKNAGEKSLLYRLKTRQPLVEALSFENRAVRYSAAIAIAQAGPSSDFPESELVVKNLAEAVIKPGDSDWSASKTDAYAVRAAGAMLKLVTEHNKTIDLAPASEALISATKDERAVIQIMAGAILAGLDNPNAQRAIAMMALDEKNDSEVRIKAFESLAVSAKLNARLLPDDQIDSIYALVSSVDADPALRSAAATAFGSLNLESKRVKDLILDQAK